MSDIKVEGFKVSSIFLSTSTIVIYIVQSSDVLAALADVFASYSEAEKKNQIKKVGNEKPSLDSLLQ